MKNLLLCSIITLSLYSTTSAQDCLNTVTAVENSGKPLYFTFVNQIQLEDEKRQSIMMTNAVTHNKAIAIFLVPNVDELCPDKGDSVSFQFRNGRVIYLKNVLPTSCDKKLAVLLGVSHGNDQMLDSMTTNDLASITVHHKDLKFRGEFNDGRAMQFKSNLQCLRDALTSDTLANALKESSRDEVFMVVETQPEYVGGYGEMMKFIAKNMKMPKETGTVYVTFVIGKDGALSDIKALKGLSPKADAEAIRVVSLMPKWKPGMQNGKPVFVRFNLPIRFR